MKQEIYSRILKKYYHMPIPLSDTNPEAVRKALDNLKPNSDFHGEHDAALARSRADWLHGIN